MISINYRDSRPIYEQIRDGLRNLLLSGAIAKDEKLPSVRDLASSLAINPNTIQRAYRDLESEGYIYSISGRGSFASGRSDFDSKRRRELTDKLTEIIKEMFFSGVSREDLVSLIDNIYMGGNSND